MKLDSVEIKNFRSVEYVDIDFDSDCKILVGINESGKTNILRAMSFLSPSEKPTKDDLREPLPDDDEINEAFVRFIFRFDQGEIDLIANRVLSKIITKKQGDPILEKDDTKYSLREFCNLRDSGVYRVDVLKLTKLAKYFVLNKDFSVLDNWMKPSKICPDNYFIQVSKNKNLNLKQYSLINVKDCPVKPEFVEKATPIDVNALVGNEISRIINENIPDVLFWQYNDSLLLPPSINIEEFAAKPDSCIPLKNMFLLAGITNIGENIKRAQGRSRNALISLFDRVAKKATAHFRRVWHEYKNVQFVLQPDGGNIIPAVKDKVQLDFQKRSDGFKRFVSFLLMISMVVKSEQMKNTLLLIDEPDIGLHPSASRCLRDELLNISKDVSVLYSTHSIFMIDNKSIDRHIIVKKTNDKTSIETASEHNIVEEELLFRALGYSVYEMLKEKNIIFEGWRDKKLFETAMRRSKKHADLVKKFKNIGIFHAQGVKHVKCITPGLELANRNCIIVSDSDKPALEKQTEFNKNRGFGDWFTYADLIPGIDATTGEDFIEIKKLMFVMNKIKSKIGALSSVTESDIDSPRGFIHAVSVFLGNNGVKKDDRKPILELFKTELFDVIEPADIKDDYFRLLDKLSDKLSAL